MIGEVRPFNRQSISKDELVALKLHFLSIVSLLVEFIARVVHILSGTYGDIMEALVHADQLVSIPGTGPIHLDIRSQSHNLSCVILHKYPDVSSRRSVL